MIDSQFSKSSGIMQATLISNFPQLVISFLYFNYNSIFTSMLVAKEWSEYGSKRKPLRVTSPRGRQRSTYWLQLPFRYGISLLVASTLLHWFISQSLFIIAINDLGNNDTTDSLTVACGYSPIAILFAMVLGSVCIALSIGFGFRKYDASVPFVGSCSAAISASCHRPEDDILAFERPVMFGKSNDHDQETGGLYAGYSLTSFKLIPRPPEK